MRPLQAVNEVQENRMELQETCSASVTEKSATMLQQIEEKSGEIRQLYTAFTEAEEPEQYRETVENTLRDGRETVKNLRRAYFRATAMYDELAARWRELTQRRRRFFNPPANAKIDLAEGRTAHFAKGMNLYKLLLICYIGSFVGVLIEMVWCLLWEGRIESRAGLVFGPFNLLYGVGAVAITFALYRVRNHGRWLSFVGGFLVGSAVEYICSLVQELCFGSRSWDYTNLPFNVDGRICLIYSVFWGLLGVAWVKWIYPVLAKLILKVPNRIGRVLTWVIFAFFVINAIFSVLAVYRWSQRMAALPAGNALWAWIDTVFPDDYMRRVFANMEFS